MQIASLIQDKAPIAVLSEYTNFTDMFFSNLTAKLLEHTRVNNYLIDLVKSYQRLYKSIYSLGSVELKTLKTYIETNLVNGFIKSSKSPARTLIFFMHKLNRNL